MPFPGGIVRSGSKIGGKYKGMIASTNDAFAPTLRGVVKSELGARRQCRTGDRHRWRDQRCGRGGHAGRHRGRGRARAGRGAARISAGNYGGKLGKFLYHLKDLLP